MRKSKMSSFHLQPFLYYFNITFPLKTLSLNKNNNKWITKGLLVSKNKLRILRGLKRTKQLSNKSKNYIETYQSIYKHLLKEAKKLHNEKFISLSSNKTKGLWWIINKELGKTPHSLGNMQLYYNSKIINNPKIISEQFN